MARDVIDTEYGDDRPTIAFRANSVRQKARWERAVQESDEYGSVSHLLRRAVERELAGANEPQASGQASTQAGGGVTEQQFAELTEAVNRIEVGLEDISQSVENVEENVFDFPNNGLPDELLTKLYELVPVGREYVGAEPAQAENLFSRSDLPENEAYFGFEQLYKEVDNVERERGDDGEMYYYREE